jgi:hypothetical protein
MHAANNIRKRRGDMKGWADKRGEGGNGLSRRMPPSKAWEEQKRILKKWEEEGRKEENN